MMLQPLIRERYEIESLSAAEIIDKIYDAFKPYSEQRESHADISHGISYTTLDIPEISMRIDVTQKLVRYPPKVIVQFSVPRGYDEEVAQLREILRANGLEKKADS